MPHRVGPANKIQNKVWLKSEFWTPPDRQINRRLRNECGSSGRKRDGEEEEKKKKKGEKWREGGEKTQNAGKWRAEDWIDGIRGLCGWNLLFQYLFSRRLIPLFFLNVTAGEREKRGLQNLPASSQQKERDYQTVGEKQYFKLSLNYGDKLSEGGGRRTDQRLPLRAHTRAHEDVHSRSSLFP